MKIIPLPAYLVSNTTLQVMIRDTLDVCEACGHTTEQEAEFMEACAEELRRRGQPWKLVDGKFTQD